MIIKLLYQNEEKFGYLETRASLGSARSNQFILAQKSMPALQGVFVKENEVLVYRDFERQQDYVLKPLESVETRRFQITCLGCDEFLKKDFMKIWSYFYSFLQDEGLDQIDKCLEMLRQKYFLTNRLPDFLIEQIQKMISEFRTHGPVELLLKSPEITDILVEDHSKILVEQAGRIKSSHLSFFSQQSYLLYIENLLAKFHRKMDENTPYAEFSDDEAVRYHIIGPPATSGQTYLSIRKPQSITWSLESLAKRGMIDSQRLKLIRTWIRDKKNLLICGSTGSGKTTLLRALVSEVPKNQRIAILEDAPELRIDRPNSFCLQTRTGLEGGFEDISLAGLVRQSLRMRPDRLVIGEVRGPEAQDLINAMNTGHSGSMTTIHANSCRDAVWRLRSLMRYSQHSLSDEASLELIVRNINAILFVERAENGRRRLTELMIVKSAESGDVQGEQICVA